MPPQHKRKTSKAPPIDKLIKPAIGIGLALLAYQFFKGLDSEIPRLDPTDELVLRDVLFGEGDANKSYVVLCHKEDSTHISSVVQDAHNDGSAPAEFRLLDCDYILPSSQKSIAERFKLNMKTRPTVFVSGAAGPPKQIPSKHLKTGKMLVKLLKNMLEPRAAKIETTQDLRTKCLNQNVCGLLLKGSKTVNTSVKNAVSNLLEQHPNVAFASVDTSVLFIKNLEEYLPEYQPGVHRFVVFQKVSGGINAKDERLVTSIATLDDSNNIGYASMNTLVQSVVDGKAEMTKLSALPMVKTRTKKLEEEERAKRQRKEQQQASGTGGSTSTPGGQFAPNDGSREGRKAERERRRAEHYAEHNVKPKTPEEIQEMERKRRIRMEEEAERWNMAPEDADGESNGGYDIEDESDEGEYVVEDANEEDDEDVIDLD
jgi:hypothetical protein